jgi:Helix-turn-helix
MKNKNGKSKKNTLEHYLEQIGIKHYYFAKKIGVTAKTLSRVINGFMPTLKMAIEIEKATDGKIGVYDWDTSKTAHCTKPENTNNKKSKKGDS